MSISYISIVKICILWCFADLLVIITSNYISIIKQWYK